MPNEYSMIGKRIREKRLKLGLTIQELAETADISDNFLGNIERGNGQPSIETLLKVVNALGVDANYVMRDYIDVAVDGTVENSTVQNEIANKVKLITKNQQQFILQAIEFFVND